MTNMVSRRLIIEGVWICLQAMVNRRFQRVEDRKSLLDLEERDANIEEKFDAVNKPL